MTGLTPRRLRLLCLSLAMIGAPAAHAGPAEDLAQLTRRIDDAELADEGRLAREPLGQARTAVGEARAHLQARRSLQAQRAWARGKAWARLAEALLASARAEREARQANAEADALDAKASALRTEALELEQRLSALELQPAPAAEAPR